MIARNRVVVHLEFPSVHAVSQLLRATLQLSCVTLKRFKLAVLRSTLTVLLFAWAFCVCVVMFSAGTAHHLMLLFSAKQSDVWDLTFTDSCKYRHINNNVAFGATVSLMEQFVINIDMSIVETECYVNPLLRWSCRIQTNQVKAYHTRWFCTTF